MVKVNLSAFKRNRIEMIRSNCRKQSSKWNIEKIDSPFDYTIIHLSAKEAVDRVASVDETAIQFIAGGGDVIRPKLTIPGIGSLITCEDASGQRFSFIEEEFQDQS